eukprot:TRINITY_DN13069_c0_g1_i3.p1 TRINITY_DN13069_c0_g1~~TRINITY_DN13069_c0_g1_i3.p1  ORF type:complete len:482 (+),score=82.81 TRINITY_DN13069_c0_g1_i3:69-1514(+)
MATAKSVLRSNDPGLTMRILDDASLVALLLAMLPHGALVALRRTCRRWSSDAYLLAPDGSRRLAKLTTWPASLRDSSDSGDASSPATMRPAASRDLQLRAWRERVLESIRMQCQDDVSRSSASGNNDNGDNAEETAGRGYNGFPRGGHLVEWYNDFAFKDTNLTDAELYFALARAQPGDVRRLSLCSSQLSDAGVIKALGHVETLRPGSSDSQTLPAKASGLRASRCSDVRSNDVDGIAQDLHWARLENLCVAACRARRRKQESGRARGDECKSSRERDLPAGQSTTALVLNSRRASLAGTGLSTALTPAASRRNDTQASTGGSSASTSAAGDLSGDMLEPLTAAASVRRRLLSGDSPALALQRLVLLGVPRLRLAPILANCRLKMLMVQGQLSDVDLDAVAGCSNLNLYKLDENIGGACFRVVQGMSRGNAETRVHSACVAGALRQDIFQLSALARRGHLWSYRRVRSIVGVRHVELPLH